MSAKRNAYCASSIAVQSLANGSFNVYTTAHTVLSSSKEDAERLCLATIREACPEDKGWYKHSVVLAYITPEDLQVLING